MTDTRPNIDQAHPRATSVPKRRSSGPAALSGVRLVERHVFRDGRGAFSELWRADEAEVEGFPRFVQDNVATSRRGVVRGLHFQNPRGQAKLVTVAVGDIFDVAVDLRAGSRTFGRWAAYRLSESSGQQLYLPAGFAHGYQTISDWSVVIYKCSDVYSPDDEQTVRWNDDDLGIDWPIREAVLSPRDATAPLLRDIPTERLPQVDW